MFGAQNKPQTGFNFGASTTGLGTSAFGAPTGTGGSLFSAKPTVFGTGTAFGANTGTGVFGATGTLGTGLGTGTLGTGKEQELFYFTPLASFNCFIPWGKIFQTESKHFLYPWWLTDFMNFFKIQIKRKLLVSS